MLHSSIIIWLPAVTCRTSGVRLRVPTAAIPPRAGNFPLPACNLVECLPELVHYENASARCPGGSGNIGGRVTRGSLIGTLGVAALPALALAQPGGGLPERFTAGTTQVTVEWPESGFPVGTEALMNWVRRSIAIVSAYYGRFPVTKLRLELVANDGSGVQTGSTWGENGGFIRLRLGREVTEGQLQNDWVLVHEMTHLALPDVGEAHAWLSEGLAVYVEGIERVQAGNRTEGDVFAEEMRMMPRGMPEPGDEGLDRTHTWARTYWGGAMFCLLADVAIHQQTANHYGLQDGMRAVLERSGGLSSHWSIERVLQTADDATGTHVLEQLDTQMKDQPVAPDLRALWQQLGVTVEDGAVRLSDDAPLSDVRKSIMRPRTNRPVGSLRHHPRVCRPDSVFPCVPTSSSPGAVTMSEVSTS